MHLDNGNIYINSPQMPAHCQYSRANITADDNAYNKAIYTFALSAHAQGNKIKIVVEDTQISTPCFVSGIM